MKKFLTVLLVIAVMFTFSFSSAFATGYSWENGAITLTEAKAEAKAFINAYTVEDLTAIGELQLSSLKVQYGALIDDATAHGTNDGQLSAIVSAFVSATNACTTAEVSDAQKDATYQYNDYLKLFVDMGVVSTTDFGYASVTSFTNCTTKAQVEAKLADLISAVDKYVLDLPTTKFAGDYLTTASITSLKLKLRSYANTIFTGAAGEHTDAVKAEYEALVNQAVAELGTLKTTNDWKKFAVKYGYVEGANQPEENVACAYYDDDANKIVIVRSGYGLLPLKALETKNAAYYKEFATKVLAQLGEYDYTKIADATKTNTSVTPNKEATYWEFAEGIHDYLDDLAAYGTSSKNHYGLTVSKDLSKATGMAAAVEEAADYYDTFTKLYAYKADAKAEYSTNTKYDYDGYQGSWDAYVEAAWAAIDAAADEAAVDAVVAQYDAIFDTFVTKLDASKTDAVKAYNKAMDEYFDGLVTGASYTSTKYYDDMKAIVDKMKANFADLVDDATATTDWNSVADVKGNTKAAYQVNAVASESDWTVETILLNLASGSDVVMNAAMLKALGYDLGTTTDAFKTYKWVSYTSEEFDRFTEAKSKSAAYNRTYEAIRDNDYAVNKILKRWHEKVELPAWSHWTTLNEAFNEVVAEKASYTPDDILLYKLACTEADEAVAKIATPEDTAAYKALLDKAAGLVKDASTKWAAIKANYSAAKRTAYGVAAYDTTAYDTAKYAYDYLIYSKEAWATTVHDGYADYTQIYASMTNKLNTVYPVLTSAAKAELTNIKATAQAAIADAKTGAAVTAACETAIAAMANLALDQAVIDAGNKDYEDEQDVAGHLAYAQKYFATWEKVAFTSNATTNWSLAKDVAAFSKGFDLSEEAAKAYLQDLAIAARSTKTSKGSIKVTLNANVAPLTESGYTVEYKFYRSTKSNKNYKLMITKKSNTYTNTNAKKGVKYFYKAKLVVKDATGKVVATSPLTQCKYACRTR